MISKRSMLLVGVLVCAQFPVLAHEGLKEPAVLARMQSMKEMGAATKLLGQMAKRQTAFEAQAARQALERISEEAARTPDLFAGAEEDPNSEALPTIWESFTEFEQLASRLEQAAVVQADTVAERDDLRAALQALGTTCRDWHEAYRRP